jgi:hypothetical protein
MNRKKIFLLGTVLLIGLMLTGCVGYYGGYGYYDYPHYNYGYGYYGYPHYRWHEQGEHHREFGEH